MVVPAQIRRWHACPSLQTLQQEACSMILEIAEKAIGKKGIFRIVLAGGSTPRGLYEKLEKEKSDWGSWEVYFGDERCLPPDHPERNSLMAFDSWLSRSGIPEKNIHVIEAELGPEKGASRYCETLKGVGEFDLVLLGLGEDGHTASLFPGKKWEEGDAIAVHDAPKPPPDRISLSPARLSFATKVCFLVSGESKKQAVSDWRNGKPIPASFIVPDSGVDIFMESFLSDKEWNQNPRTKAKQA